MGKIDIINKIMELHPSCGVHKGWSYWAGGVRDSNDWNYNKMLEISFKELYEFYNNNK